MPTNMYGTTNIINCLSRIERTLKYIRENMVDLNVIVTEEEKNVR